MPSKPPTHDPLPPFLRAKMQQQREADKEARRKEYERRPERAADRAFYGGVRWTKFRDYLLTKEEFALCRECIKLGRVEPTVAIDHIKPRKERPDLAYNEDNCQGLCASCHAKKTRRGE